MKMTLLAMVQDILNDMDSDPVNSISDTEEASQIAQIIKTTYYALLARQDWPFLKGFSTLTALADTDNPTKMLIPESVAKIYWIRYNGELVEYVDPVDFKHMIDSRTEQAGVVDANGYILTGDPVYWTSYDDGYVWFDRYDEDTESTVQEANTSAYCLIYPSWTATDAAYPTLPAKMFPLLLAEAKGTAFIVLKQQANAKVEALAKTMRSQMQKESWRVNDGEPRTNSAVNYGRK